MSRRELFDAEFLAHKIQISENFKNVLQSTHGFGVCPFSYDLRNGSMISRERVGHINKIMWYLSSFATNAASAPQQFLLLTVQGVGIFIVIPSTFQPAAATGTQLRCYRLHRSSALLSAVTFPSSVPRAKQRRQQF